MTPSNTKIGPRKMRDKFGRFIKGHKTNLGKKFGQMSPELKNKMSGIMKDLVKQGRITTCFLKGHKTNVGWNPSRETRMKMSLNHRGTKNPLWKGGIIKHENGYLLKLCPGHPYAQKVGRGYVLIHRLITEKAMGRLLKRTEIVHHINGDKKDNRLENLMVLCDRQAHIKIHFKPETLKTEQIIFDGSKSSNG